MSSEITIELEQIRTELAELIAELAQDLTISPPRRRLSLHHRAKAVYLPRHGMPAPPANSTGLSLSWPASPAATR